MRLNAPSPALAADVARIASLWSEGSSAGGAVPRRQRVHRGRRVFCRAFRVQTSGLQLPPAAAAYAKRLLALASMQRWYQAGLAEPWRDAPHEEETARVGRILEDLRKAGSAA